LSGFCTIIVPFLAFFSVCEISLNYCSLALKVYCSLVLGSINCLFFICYCYWSLFVI